MIASADLPVMAAASFGVSFCILIGLISSGTIIDDYCFIRTILLIVFPTATAMLASPHPEMQEEFRDFILPSVVLAECSTLVHGNYKYIFRFKSRYLPSGTTISFHFNASHFVKKSRYLYSKAGATHTSDTCLFVLCCQLPVSSFYFQL